MIFLLLATRIQKINEHRHSQFQSGIIPYKACAKHVKTLIYAIHILFCKRTYFMNKAYVIANEQYNVRYLIRPEYLRDNFYSRIQKTLFI